MRACNFLSPDFRDDTLRGCFGFDTDNPTLGGLFRLFGSDSVLRCSDVAIQSGKLLVIDLGFGEQDLPGMVFFRHLVFLLFAVVVLLRALLRFEPNLDFPLFGS
jgi:hypothetical protein